MHCANCGHAHTRTEQAVRYKHPSAGFGWPRYEDIVEETLMICTAPGCRCYELDPTDYEDRVALIAAGEISP